MNQPEPDEVDEDAFSLEELGAAYKHLVARSDEDQWAPNLHTGEVLQREQLIAAQSVEPSASDPDASQAGDDDEQTDETFTEEPEAAPTPEAIIEAALFVGNPNGNGITAARLASIMRDMTPEEVVSTIESLNASYRTNRQASELRATRPGTD